MMDHVINNVHINVGVPPVKLQQDNVIHVPIRIEILLITVNVKLVFLKKFQFQTPNYVVNAQTIILNVYNVPKLSVQNVKINMKFIL